MTDIAKFEAYVRENVRRARGFGARITPGAYYRVYYGGDVACCALGAVLVTSRTPNVCRATLMDDVERCLAIAKMREDGYALTHDEEIAFCHGFDDAPVQNPREFYDLGVKLRKELLT